MPSLLGWYMNSSLSKDFKVAVVGGGISGLFLAVALVQVGVYVEIFEAAVGFSSNGSL